MATLILATGNRHKASEIQSILGNGFRYLTLEDLSGAPKAVEDAGTFAGNATKKAVELATWLEAARDCEHAPHLAGEAFVLADDSGLEVDALDGAPGVHSARFAAMDSGSDGNSADVDNNAKLLRLLEAVLAERRGARFRCVLALAPVLATQLETASPVCAADECELQMELFEGVCEGRIGFEPRGGNGFGYDPLFTPDGFDQTFAELGDNTKNQISHRAKALVKLRKFLNR